MFGCFGRGRAPPLVPLEERIVHFINIERSQPSPR